MDLLTAVTADIAKEHATQQGARRAVAKGLVAAAIAGGESARSQLEEIVRGQPASFVSGFAEAVAYCRFDRAAVREIKRKLKE